MASVAVIDEGSGAGSVRVYLRAITDLAVVSAITITPPSANQAPDKPTLSAAALNFHEIRLSMSPGSDDVGVVTRALFRDGALLTTLPPNSTSYTDSNLDLDTLYAYEIQDADEEGLTARSDQANARTLDTYRIDSGQSLDYTDSNGDLWVADTCLLYTSDAADE